MKLNKLKMGPLLVFAFARSAAFAQDTQEAEASPKVEPEAEQHAAQDTNSLEAEDQLNLMCFGAGAANKVTVGRAYGSSSGSAVGTGGFATYSGSANATVYGTRSQGFEDQVSLYLTSEEGRVRMPRTMLPVIRGGEDGWFKLKNISIGEREITASVAVNVFNNPKLRVDRYTGAISISGKAGDYSGMCQRYKPAEMERQF